MCTTSAINHFQMLFHDAGITTVHRLHWILVATEKETGRRAVSVTERSDRTSNHTE